MEGLRRLIHQKRLKKGTCIAPLWEVTTTVENDNYAEIVPLGLTATTECFSKQRYLGYNQWYRKGGGRGGEKFKRGLFLICVSITWVGLQCSSTPCVHNIPAYTVSQLSFLSYVGFVFGPMLCLHCQISPLAIFCTCNPICFSNQCNRAAVRASCSSI